MPRVYFFCGNEQGNLQEDVIALAEGFVELGIPFCGNCEYWLQSTRSNDYLVGTIRMSCLMIAIVSPIRFDLALEA